MTAQALEQRELAVVIGLEVHVQLETATKIFCSCSTEPAEDEEPNTRVCPVCLGLPGALPVLNEAAVESAVKIGKALNADIAEDTRFHRKNYYYPDLPKNFQITQYDAPICADGTLEVSVEGTRRDIGITRAHLEEDPGSLQHKGGSIDTADYTLVNYNRAGTPLVEIVTEPDFRSPQETRAFLAKLEEVLEYLGVFDATRDGSLRIDANISLVPADEVDDDGAISDDALEAANRTEVKNISSHKGAEKALAYEVTRQKNAIQRGRAVEQETRHWDESRGITVSMRSKEEEKDYRYFREADLPPLQVAHWKEEIPIPELPDARRERFHTEYGIDEESASKLTSTKEVADFFEDVAAEFDADLAATWVADNLLGELNYRDMHITDVSDRLDEFTRLVELVAADEVTTKNAEEIVLREMLDEGKDPDTIVDEAGLGKADDDEIGGFVQEAIDENPDAVEDYHNGEGGALNFLVGQVMQKSQGSADPGTVNRLLRERLDE
ncbi:MULTISPECIES: Asp-tRNA(Asn)/Glu-tRNA(Gln) amidotransferase subunit GatB [unclassified Haloferax]|jgi:aspartyl-tRNA(Asn)/glutamyl-tRNA(Gln) amidotransferase subunit B|uniref:Asp-tRNA(Asn)/Glu-tRNA(Gln) amidotransferase subunit GatB n=1 Tax=unclassified Haloferax TaxID=2625095 RepID=UPI000E2649C0|nr:MULTISPECIES: Asp-tRNA(Asn)/Glu-tRNA(Gln) amidotransferase subunit GatB [unclassified Haloferax]RDZ37178.1 Asp-tRNA(Asn)/Glu-tRNA(Gln) amidotransferase GatCAB subunit B [Haloferax sp. Atlit-24N]RLM37975.1 Asp-tRNA(Asn)/Glu-tRNA(Gln) amidotransferase subunit GatB [Haloferax sp. Atlit-109R]RLM45918.1 Asp-tRNA(Asn)/Glu-tRNA(Gln) amidotransferase subunit GatB [Haloferax sp. Atlit-105R]